jgi:predicted GNAT family N-acyltransferase
MQKGHDPLTFREATLKEILPLRHKILRPGKTRDAAIFPGDDQPATRHFAAVEDGQIVACLTMLHTTENNQDAWQLRGMAVAAEMRRKGIGAKLLTHAERVLKRSSATRTLWCNARTPAVEFYVKQGWKTVGNEFEVEGVGPHFKMVKAL